jgi:hypothetical protein
VLPLVTAEARGGSPVRYRLRLTPART